MADRCWLLPVLAGVLSACSSAPSSPARPTAPPTAATTAATATATTTTTATATATASPSDIGPTRTGFVEVPRDHAAKAGETFRLYYERYPKPAGSHKRMIFLHGGPGHTIPFQLIASKTALGASLVANYEVVYFHQRGSGKSDPGLTPEQVRGSVENFDIGQHVEDVEAIRRAAFGDDKMTLIGASWGGYLGLAYASRYAEHLDAVILGSFDAQANTITNFCRNIDPVLQQALKDHPALQTAVDKLGAAIDSKKVVWHAGRKDAVVLQRRHLLDVLMPFAVKAKYGMAVGVVEGLAAGNAKAVAFLDKLEDISEEVQIRLGETAAGAATFCQNFADYRDLERRIARPAATKYCDDAAMTKAFVANCRAIAPHPVPFDMTARLAELELPALVFAGSRDPLVPWRATEQAAKSMKNATFLLVREGGHSPVGVGGRCLGDIVSQFAKNPASLDTSCLR